MSDENEKKDEEQRPATSPYPMSRLAPAYDLVDVAKEIQAADSLVSAVVTEKLSMLAEQIRALQTQAKRVLEDAKRDAILHRATCHFKKRPGAVYHLYERPDSRLYFSMLSPEDWGNSAPHPFRGSYRLEVDLSWTAADDLAKKSDQREMIERLLLP